MKFRSTKTYGHEVGLSACFRQWRAMSHCRFLHGYALAVRLEFEADVLDDRNWVVDFGSLKPFKAWLEETFDHKTLVAFDDPMLGHFRIMDQAGLIQIVEVPAVGCEAFAAMIFRHAQEWIDKDPLLARRVRIALVEVREHGANSAVALA